ncbi:MAG TPA: hypothetical protein VK072_01085 [Candidatus Avamphibacillus sp.]|nr:hypothetical protein [Candidatus Avamphibacillus sp.]
MCKKILLPVLLLFFLIGCSANVIEDDLIGGTWSAIAGYKDGKPEGEPDCLDFMIGGLEFIDDTVHGKEFDEDFNYRLEDRKKGIAISINRKGVLYSYYIDKVNDDAIGLVGANGFQEDESCYFERQ